MPSFSSQDSPYALPKSQLSLTQMPLDILILFLWGCSFPPQHHAMKTLLWHTKTHLSYYLQFFELKKSQKHNNGALFPLVKRGNGIVYTQLDMAALLHRLPAQSSTDMSEPRSILAQSTKTIHPELISRHGCKVQTHRVFRNLTPNDPF